MSKNGSSKTLKFEKPAEYNGKIVYGVGTHEVPLVAKDGTPGWAQRWIARGAIDIDAAAEKEQEDQAELEAKALKAKADAEALLKKATDGKNRNQSSNQRSPAQDPPKSQDSKSENKDQDGQKVSANNLDNK